MLPWETNFHHNYRVLRRSVNSIPSCNYEIAPGKFAATRQSQLVASAVIDSIFANGGKGTEVPASD